MSDNKTISSLVLAVIDTVKYYTGECTKSIESQWL